MKILKFGGTSLNDAKSIQLVVAILLEELKNGDSVIGVCSAMGGVTNQLLRMAQDTEKNTDFSQSLKELEERHFKAIHELLPAKSQNAALLQIKFFLNELEELLQGIRALKELSPKTQDKILSYGELCSTMILTEVLKNRELQACFLDTRQLIVTDSSFGHAVVNKKRTDQQIHEIIGNNNCEVFCTTGFIAANESGQTTTLGRGGSDYTAAIFGAALEAAEIQIWTDVDGFMTADPRLVKGAFSLPEISYTEAKELSYFGAKVIYPPALIPAFTKNIPIRIKNTFNKDFPGTIIQRETPHDTRAVRGLSSISNVSLVNIQGSALIGNSGFSGRLFSSLAKYGINIILITQASSEHSISFAVSPEDTEKTKDALAKEFEMELFAHRIDPPQIDENLCIIAIVGEKMKSTTGVSGTLFHALGRNGINVVATAQGSTELNISVVIDNKDLAKALNVLHEAFFLSDVKTLNVFYVGIGNIGKALLEQIKENEKHLVENNLLKIQMIGLTNSRRMIFNPEGFEITDWKKIFEQNSEAADLIKFVQNMKALNLPNSVFVDNSASEIVTSFYEDILKSNISIVTCNKIGNSGSYELYQKYKQAVRKHGVSFLYETNVGAGLPIINTLKNLLISGDQIVKIEAILSGTISYIFNNFKEDHPFHEVVKEAQDKGLTEPDPREDLSGMDFKRKMLILARECGYPLEMRDVVMESILPKTCLNAKDVSTFYEELKNSNDFFEKLKKDAQEKGGVLRLIGTLQNGNANIALKIVDQNHPFYSLSGSDNIISFTTNRYHEQYPLVVKGPGAGADVTAAGVFADLVTVGAE